MIAPLLTREAHETALAFALRVDREYHAHLRACRACNLDHDCFACSVGEETEDPRFHSCNCDVVRGFGVRLRELYVQTRPIRMAARKPRPWP